MNVEGIKAILTDIEGTTSSISFVHDVLFPYAAEKLPEFVQQNENDLGDIFDQIREIENDQNLDRDQIIYVMLRWIKEDKKATPLKTLQGMIWKDGYETDAFKGHIYDDAADVMHDWYEDGYKIYIYSSGSIAAQKLIYGYSESGDITQILSGYFDTTTGPKLEAESYVKISKEIGLPPAQILFLSDNQGEITAANNAGMQTILVDREGKNPDAVFDFNSIHILEKAA